MPAPIPPGLSTRTVHDFRAVNVRAFVPRSTYDEGEAVLILDGEDCSTLAIHMPTWLPSVIVCSIACHPDDQRPRVRLMLERLAEGEEPTEAEKPAAEASEDRVRPFVEDLRLDATLPRCDSGEPCSADEGSCDCVEPDWPEGPVFTRG